LSVKINGAQKKNILKSMVHSKKSVSTKVSKEIVQFQQEFPI